MSPLVFLAVLIGYVQAYGSGAPPAACASMEPAPGAHPTNLVSEGDTSPFELMAMPLEGGRRVMGKSSQIIVGPNHNS